MKSTKEILAELGFDPESSRSTQEAFLKHLIHAAHQTRPTPLSSAAKAVSEVSQKHTDQTDEGPVQLSFDFESGKRVS